MWVYFVGKRWCLWKINLVSNINWLVFKCNYVYTEILFVACMKIIFHNFTIL